MALCLNSPNRIGIKWIGRKKGKVLCFRQAREVLDTVEWPLVFIPEGLAPRRVMYSSGFWLSFLQRYSSVALCG